MSLECTLCDGEAFIFKRIKERVYYACSGCGAVLLDPRYHPSPDDERKRYLEHNNDIHDIRYQKFVDPLVAEVKQNYSKDNKGLDFGAGTGPVITMLLRDSGYNVELYDPFFWNNTERLKYPYDYIVCCEVIEHFKNPADEFKLLRSLLNKNGMLLCKTSLYNEDIDFDRWRYKDDLTHVIFYTKDSLIQIKGRYNFSSLAIGEHFIKFTA
ncbi:MAG: class I SAM-dependent methyltransferase [Spirochaetes bacterium]|nr:class I SAM-dependent methyltransferase [Spirochaetota bacterium]